MRGPDPSIKPEGFTATFEGTILPPRDGTYTLRLNVGGHAVLFGPGPQLPRHRQQCGRPPVRHRSHTTDERPTLSHSRGLLPPPRDAPDRTRLGNSPRPLPDSRKALDDAARKADAVIFIGGLDHSVDTEGRDRQLAFPETQQAIIKRIAKLNSGLAVVLINGFPSNSAAGFPMSLP